MIRSWRAPRASVLHAADRLLDHAWMRARDAIDLRVVAAVRGAAVVEEPMTRGDASLSRSESGAIIAVDERIAGTTRGRFAIAHEIGHLALHPDIGLLAFCKGSGHFFQREIDASDFAARLLVPPRLLDARARFFADDAHAVAARFHVSLATAAQALLDHRPRPAAVVHARADVVAWWAASDAFPFKLARGARLTPRDAASPIVPAHRYSKDRRARKASVVASSLDLAWPEEGTLHLLEAS